MLTYIKLFYDFAETVEPLSDEEVGRLVRGLLSYARTGEAPQFSGNERFLYPGLRLQVDRDKASYEEICEKNRQNASGKNSAKSKPELSQAAQKLERLSMMMLD